LHAFKVRHKFTRAACTVGAANVVANLSKVIKTESPVFVSLDSPPFTSQLPGKRYVFITKDDRSINLIIDLLLLKWLENAWRLKIV
jgi:hypothetical protein